MYIWKHALCCLVIVAYLTTTILCDCPGVYPEICWDQIDLSSVGTPPKRVRHAMVAIGNNFYFSGGLDPSTNTMHNDIWRIVASPPGTTSPNRWTAVSVTQITNNAPFEMKARMDHVMVHFQESDTQNTLYIHGGVGDIRLKDIWRYNINRNDWDEMGEPQSGQGNVAKLFGHTAIMMNDPFTNGLDSSLGRVWIYGGTDATNAIRNELHTYNPPNNDGTSGSNDWVVTGTTSFATTQHCAVIVHPMCMYIYGGISVYSPFTVTNAIAEYCAAYPNPLDTTTQTRTLGFTTYTPTDSGVTPIGRLNRYGHSCTKADDRLLVFGGKPNIAQPNFSNDMIDYDPILNIWGSVEQGVMHVNSSGTPPGGREEHAGIGYTFNGEYYHLLFGGWKDSTYYDDMWSINYRRPRCEAGYYSADGTLNCLPCPAGTISGPGSYNCTNCTAGQYTNGTGDSQCRDCPPGTYTLDFAVGAESQCTPCAVGTYSPIYGRDSICDPCPAGTYSTNTTGRPFCFNCTGGTANPLTGQIPESVCLNCSVGFYAPPGSPNCIPCAGGYYAPHIRMESCFICAGGTWSDLQSTNCTNCTIGTSNNAPGSAGEASCQPCPAGTYAPRPATPQCIHCRPGTYSTTVGATTVDTCLECPLGTFNNGSAGPGIFACKNCSAGTYQNTTGAAYCYDCPVGRYNEKIRSVGIEDCLPCPAGTYSPVTGTPALASCIDCEIGRYQPVVGSSFCRLCPNGTYSTTRKGDAISDCLECPADTYSEEGKSSCLPCPGSTQQVIQSGGNYTLTGKPDSFSFPGWEQCQSCTDDTSYGWVRNGHFDGNPYHEFWTEDVNFGCTVVIEDSYMKMTTTNDATDCSYKQQLTFSTLSTFPFRISAKSKSSISSTGGSAAYRVRYEITLKNGTKHELALDFTDNASWNEQSLHYRPDQINTRARLDDKYIIDNVWIFLEFNNMQGEVQWDDITFSPYSKNMCNCSRTHVEAEFFTIDLFERDTCDLCTIGKFCNGAGQFQCPDDTYSFGGYTSCLACAKGLACKDGIATTCGATQFKNTTSNQCQDCPIDSGCRNTDRHICSPGTYGQGKRHCLPCHPGSFCSATGCTSCEICPQGQTSNFLRTGCFGCPVGQYSNSDGLCESCPIGSYSNSTGSSSCHSCPGGQTTSCRGARGIEYCS